MSSCASFLQIGGGARGGCGCSDWFCPISSKEGCAASDGGCAASRFRLFASLTSSFFF